jgi:transcriptional regulator with XRE-family HTH domain
MDKSIYSERYAVFLKLLRLVREGQEVTQSTLAAKLKEPQSFVSKCESGQRRLDIVELMDWCDGVGVSFIDFVRQLEIDLAAPNQK